MTDLSNQKIKSFRLAKGKTSLKQIGLILLVALFFIGLVWLEVWRVDRGIKDIGYNNLVVNESEKTTPITISPPETVSIPAKEGGVAQGFPSFIPLNGKMNIVESYSQQSRTTGEVFEAVVVFQSSKNLKENQTFYEKWANDNSWQISTSKQVNNIQLSLTNTKNKETFTIELEELLQNITKVTIVYYPTVNGEVDMDKVKEQLKIRF